MSALTEKYGISEEAAKKMIADGVISCSHVKYDEIWQEYKNISMSGQTDGVVLTVAAKCGVSRELVYKVINKFK